MNAGPIVDAVRAGSYGTTRALVLGASPADLRGAAPALRRTYRAVGAAPHGSLSPDGAWDGEAADHYDCATLAVMACVGPDRAARMSAVTTRVAADLPALFPADLELVVRTWSELFQRSPKSWDRVAHYPKMFAWVRTGLVSPPTHDGAVNLFLQEASLRSRRYSPPADPGLFGETLPRLFTAEVRPSLGAAAIDYHVPAGDPARIDELVLRLVAEGVWDATETRLRTEGALAARESPFQRRWLRGLLDRLPST
ncbi:hypothetical protein V2J56_07400 [Georgenia sp. MJ206]|uniref:hypothetical protein n=1 Tax=Georgenia wangjunii TaxID=3117730 RepID=UPI002F265481